MRKVNVVIDIETVPAELTEAQKKRYIEAYEPDARLKDPEKIEEHKRKYMRSALDKYKFRIDGCRPISAALGIIHNKDVSGIESKFSEDSSDIAPFIANYLNEVGDFELVGFNLKRFDLPIIAKATSLADVEWKVKLGKWTIKDLCEWPLNNTYKLKDACLAFGIDIPEVNGEQVEEMFNSGKHKEIEHYNREDVRITGELFIALSRIYAL